MIHILHKILIVLILIISLVSCNPLDIIQGKSTTELSQSDFKIEKKDKVPLDFIPRNLNIVSIGDSLTEGVGDSNEQGGYIPYLESYMEKNKGIKEANISNFGIKGNRTTQLLTRLNTGELKAEISKADAVIITIGGNDIMKVVKDQFSNLTMDDFVNESKGYQKRLEKIFETIRSENSDADIYLVGLYNPFGKWMSNLQELDQIMEDWNEIGKDVVNEDTNAYFIEIEDIFSNSKENLLFQEDHFHPNDRGYELIASRIYDQMKEYTVKGTNLLVNASEESYNEESMDKR